MIPSYFITIFGLIFLVFGTFLFMFSFKFKKPKLKTEEQIKTFETILKKYGSLLKLCSLILIAYGFYCIFGNPQIFQIGKEQNTEWSNVDRAELIKNCLDNTGENAKKYPKLANDFCSCSTEKIMNSMSRKEYLLSLKKTEKEQIDQNYILLKDCIKELKQKMDSLNTESK